MKVQAEMSLYPLGEEDVLPAILEFVRVFEKAGLKVEPGPMSTLVSGESGEVFGAMRAAWELAAAKEGKGRRVLVVKIMG